MDNLPGLFSQDTLTTMLLVAGLFFAMKYLPRLTLGVPFLDASAVKARMDGGEDILVLDVRTPAEFNGNLGHVPDSLNLPLGDLNKRLGELADDLETYKDQHVCVLCRTENRSPRAAKVLKRHGFKNLSVLKGGMVAWNREKLPTAGKG